MSFLLKVLILFCVIGCSLSEPELSVLITGGAGFIGSHLAIHLREKGVKNVVALDNFDSYYSVSLKRRRAERVSSSGATVVEGDICDAVLLQTLFGAHDFTHVVNLAARPGVRYAFVDPLSYIRNNMKCFTTLLEQMRLFYAKKPFIPRLLYASSSSVYGLNTKIPYSEEDPVNSPSNLYGATKRSNELIAYAYHHLFGITVIGFRFFTVYGPWGRPDMATNIFTNKILSNGTITLFNEGKLIRDFTYIDDIVAGLAGAIYRKENDKVIVYNLGNSKPILSSSFLETLEGILGKKANVRYEVSLADMPITYANSSLAQQNLNYVAKTSVQEGLQNFVEWYRGYEAESMPCDSECSYEGMCFKSLWAAAAATSRSLSAGCPVVVYTVSTQSSMVKLPPGPKSTIQCNIAFVSKHSTIWKAQLSERKSRGEGSSSLPSSPSLHNNWRLIPVGSLAAFGDTRKATRLPKLSPGKFFHEDVDHAIYLDYTNTLLREPRYYIEKFMTDSSGKRAAMVSVRNPHSADIFAEFQAVYAASRSKPDVTHSPKKLEHQQKAYEAYQQSVPGLKYDNVFDGVVLIHDLKWDPAKQFRCTWYREYQDWADRDQVAGAFVLTKMSHELDRTILGEQSEWIPVVKAKGGNAYVHILPSSVHPSRHPEPSTALFAAGSV